MVRYKMKRSKLHFLTLFVFCSVQVALTTNYYITYIVTECLPLEEIDLIDISVSSLGGKLRFSFYYDSEDIDYTNPNLLTILA